MSSSFSRRSSIVGAGVAALVAMSVGLPATANASSGGHAQQVVRVASTHSSKPTIVLVHGAFADDSSFAPVTTRLQADGYTVVNAPVPLRGLATDTEDVVSYVKANVFGPIVLVGHSYGGSVITGAADQLPQVRGLVYVDAFAPADGETGNGLSTAQPGSALAVKDPTKVFDFAPYPGAVNGDEDTYIQQEYFAATFAPMLPKAERDELAASQLPVTQSALNDPFVGTPAWKTVKSYFFIGTADKIIPPAEQEILAKRAHGVVVKAHVDHLSMLEAPGKVTALIERAAR